MPSKLTTPSRIAIVVVGLLGGLVVASSAAARPPCVDAMYQEWLDTDRIEREYPLTCYEVALDSIPQDIDDYTNLRDVIARAFQAAGGGRATTRTPQGPVTNVPPNETPAVDSTSTSVPIPLIVLGGMSAALLAAGGLGYVSRRRRERDALDV